jgi:hypothetical protein
MTDIEMTCECCDNGNSAIKRYGLWVCEECDNFECKQCGVENNMVSWCKPLGKCVCKDCASNVCGCFIGKQETLCKICNECSNCEGCECIENILQDFENDEDERAKVENATGKEEIDSIIKEYALNAGLEDAQALVYLYWKNLEKIFNFVQKMKK